MATQVQDGKPFTSSTEQVNIPSTLRERNVPDVPEDVDFIMEHLNDPNFDLKSRPPSFASVDNKKYRDDGDAESQVDSDKYSTSRAESRHSTAIDFDDESPYPEVRAAVASVDDPTMPVNTFRMWLLGVFFTLMVSGLNMVFSLRYPSVYITGIVVQLISLPMGHGLAYILPKKQFNTFGYRWTLNPGPFTIKEHVCITVMGNVVVAGAYASDVVLIQRVFYAQTPSMIYQLVLTVGSQVLGFSLGGLLRQFVVWPASMIWPGALVNSALFNTLHKNYGKRERGHMSREKFFLIALAACYIWEWFPSYIFTALSNFNWVCWIFPNSVIVNSLFGSMSGLGMSILTFDWGMVAFIGSPLVTPWWSQMNTGVAFIIFFWIVTPILYFTNTWNAAYFPISSRRAYANDGTRYQVTKILTNGILDPAKYSAYSPMFLSTTYALAYGLGFASLPAVLVHTFLWFRKDIIRRFRSSLKDERDVHSRLMMAYPEVPWWWYAIVGVLAFSFLCISAEIFPTKLPIYAIFIVVAIASCFAIPLAMLQAITNQQVPTQIMQEMIAGYMMPGRPIAVVIFKTIGYITCAQAINFSGDLKLGHYMKIPPRVMFACQMVAAIIASIWVIFIQDWMVNTIVDICHPDQPQGFICPGSTTFYTASIVWGAIGPRRLFSSGAIYSSLMWFVLVGFLAPIPFYFLARRYPLSFYRYINIPVFFAGLGAMPPASGINYVSWVLFGFIFNFVIRRLHFRWWMRYNYILSAALDSGLALATLTIFFSLGLSKAGGIQFDWWGNNVYLNTADAKGTPFKKVPEGVKIGPTSWS